MKARKFRRNCAFLSSSFQCRKSLLPTTPFEMIQECLVVSVCLLELLSKSVWGIHWSGHYILVSYGFDHFAFPGDSGKTFETMWWTLLLAVSRLKCLKPNRVCFLNNSEIMWCNLQMSELRTECYHLLRSKEAGLRDLGHVLPCDTTFSFKELTQFLWVSKQGFSVFIFIWR